MSSGTRRRFEIFLVCLVFLALVSVPLPLLLWQSGVYPRSGDYLYDEVATPIFAAAVATAYSWSWWRVGMVKTPDTKPTGRENGRGR